MQIYFSIKQFVLVKDLYYTLYIPNLTGVKHFI